MILSPYCETLGVLTLAVLGVAAGLRVARARPAFWILAYLTALALVAAIAVPRWIPELEFAAPFRWIMADRREFALSALVATVLLTAPLSKLPRRSQRILVSLFLAVFVTCNAVLPFLLPGLNYARLRSIQTAIDDAGICRQSTDYSCGPAAAVTALRRLGVTAAEGELAILAHTTSIAGTPPDSLCKAIEQRHGAEGIRCAYRRFGSIAELRGQEPVIAVVKFAFLVDHYVTVLGVSEAGVEVGDPLEGRQLLSERQFLDKWRKGGITVRRP